MEKSLGLGGVKFWEQLPGGPCAGGYSNGHGLSIKTFEIEGQGNVGFGLAWFEEFHGRLPQSMPSQAR